MHRLCLIKHRDRHPVHGLDPSGTSRDQSYASVGHNTSTGVGFIEQPQQVMHGAGAALQDDQPEHLLQRAESNVTSHRDPNRSNTVRFDKSPSLQDYSPSTHAGQNLHHAAGYSEDQMHRSSMGASYHEPDTRSKTTRLDPNSGVQHDSLSTRTGRAGQNPDGHMHKSNVTPYRDPDRSNVVRFDTIPDAQHDLQAAPTAHKVPPNASQGLPNQSERSPLDEVYDQVCLGLPGRFNISEQDSSTTDDYISSEDDPEEIPQRSVLSEEDFWPSNPQATSPYDDNSLDSAESFDESLIKELKEF